MSSEPEPLGINKPGAIIGADGEIAPTPNEIDASSGDIGATIGADGQIQPTPSGHGDSPPFVKILQIVNSFACTDSDPELILKLVGGTRTLKNLYKWHS